MAEAKISMTSGLGFVRSKKTCEHWSMIMRAFAIGTIV
jgi:hypothetical protein